MKFSNKKNKRKKYKENNQKSKENKIQEEFSHLMPFISLDGNDNNIINICKSHLSQILLIIFLIITVKVLYLIKKAQPSEVEKEITKLESKSIQPKQKVIDYFNLCSKGLNIYRKRFKKNKNPKFSIIIPVFNKEQYILPLMTNFQNQKYDNIEIVLVDDHSTDGTVELIHKYMRKDKRIVLVEHENNKGTLITRNDGVLNARGEYILFVDPDDMILDNSLEKLYEASLKYKDIDVIQFRAYKKWEKVFPWSKGYRAFDIIVKQPELSTIMFYSEGKLRQTNFFIWGKLIKRDVFLMAIKRLGDYYINQHMTLYEDIAMLFVLLSVANSYVFVDIFGYLYVVRNESVFVNKFRYKNGNRTIKDCFLLAEILFDFSKNTRYDKLMALYQINRIYLLYLYVCSFVTQGFDYIFKVLDKFIKCEVLKKEDKYYLYKLNRLFKDIQNALK